jgi:hypothetical protein
MTMHERGYLNSVNKHTYHEQYAFAEHCQKQNRAIRGAPITEAVDEPCHDNVLMDTTLFWPLKRFKSLVVKRLVLLEELVDGIQVQKAAAVSQSRSSNVWI